MAEPIPLKVTGRETTPELPPLLQPVSRAVGQGEDPFLPPGYLVPRKTFDVSPAARSAPEGVTETTHVARDDEVIVLELADGSTFITSAERLRASLEVSSPDLLGENGEILFEKLREEAAAPRGAFTQAVGGLVRKVYTFLAGEREDDIIADARDELRKQNIADTVLRGVSWAGTKALMSAIERKLDQAPGKLYRWRGAIGGKDDLEPVDLATSPPPDLARNPILVFVHGTGSSTIGSFGDLRRSDGDIWTALGQRYSGGVYAFEHRTLSESPIENAIQLVEALPAGAKVSLVSHSRGGLVADLLCLNALSAELIDNYRFELEGTGEADPDRAEKIKDELGGAHAEQRIQLGKLARVLGEKRLVIERYVRIASPANGTRLASGNFDLFLSSVLTLIGAVPVFFGSPYYSAFKRVVIEVAKNRTDPHLVPGIEAMLPDSPMARLLRDGPPRTGIQMAVIAGDIEGGNMLKRLGVLLTDFLFFENTDNDLVVDTKAMLEGVAPKLEARVLFDRGAEVSHFKYFSNLDTRVALRSWLTSDAPRELKLFSKLPTPAEYAQALAEAATRDATTADKPVVVVLPGVMGSHLRVHPTDRVWLDPTDIARGGLAKVMWGLPGIEAEELFAMSYGELCKALAKSHRVERFPYDWRQPLDVLAERLGEFLDALLRQTDKPIRLLAHSMGGLVVRACIHKRRAVMDALMDRDGARLVMCGTPNQGAHSMVENLIGKGDMLRMLVRLDLKHDMQEVLDIVAGMRGPLQLLPKPGFTDTFQGQPDGGERYDYNRAETWTAFKSKLTDFWFGNGRCAAPDQGVLDAASWLWAADGFDTPSLPPRYEKKTVYVFGIARNTPCGVREEHGRLKIVGTTRGDGTVTWDSGRIKNIGAYYWMPASHGDLLATEGYFGGLIDLVASGSTAQLLSSPPAVRAIEEPTPVVYDAGPPMIEDPVTLARGLVGAAANSRLPPPSRRRLAVTVRATDLRFVREPIMVGHYEQDPIAGPEALIDRELLQGDLTQRHTLGLYAGSRGTAVVVLRAGSADQYLRGAVVAGLGPYDGTLSVSELTESVRTGVLRYLLHIVDVLGEAPRENLSLSTLLLGYNSSANLTVGGCVEALVRGVIQANAKFYETTRLDIAVTHLNIIELYLDTAITTVYALRQLAQRLSSSGNRGGTAVFAHGELMRGEGCRQRLFDDRTATYWPRLMVTRVDGERDDTAAVGARGASDAASGEPAPIATHLRFLYVGQRARAESVVQQRQPGLVESLVRQQIDSAVWQEDLGRMLFQLMVPHDFKDAARALDRLVLVVDAYTANLPWELMLANDPAQPDDDRRPLALRAAVVRQLASTNYRRQVRQGISRTALVIGNPSVDGFGEHFLDENNRSLGDPPDLPGAQAEAEAVRQVITGLGYTVAPFDDHASASSVFAALYREPYRILHISAHGVFNLRHRDSRGRSGVVLSDGLLITAAEIQAMEIVPELVFLNCCHLGQVDIGREGNKLAASISRELIDIGVRCVIVAGWAVNDYTASLFGQVFYRELLMERRTFGEAVFKAREAAYEHDSGDITWGAFQAYGDASWRPELQNDGASAVDPSETFASPEELLDQLSSVRAEFARHRDRQTAQETRAQTASLERMLEKRCPPNWLLLPQLQSALAATWRDLYEFDKAREWFLKAIQAEDRVGNVPIRDIEQLANVEARLGERREDAGLIAQSIRRLENLNGSVAGVLGADSAPPRNAERYALLGSAYKRMASLAAKFLTRAPETPDRGEIAGILRTSLEAAAEAYRTGEGVPGTTGFSPYLVPNRLAIQALVGFKEDAIRAGAIELAEQCRLAATSKYWQTGDFWDAVMQPEALLVLNLVNGKLEREDDSADAIVSELMLAYDELFAAVLANPSQLDSVVAQFELLSRFCDALAIAENRPSLRRLADRLLTLAQHVSPGRPVRSDRPPPTAPPPRPEQPRPARRRPRARRAPRRKKP